MLVGKALVLQQLNLVESLQVGQLVSVEDKRQRLETIYEPSDQILLEMIQNRLRREVLIHKRYIKLYESKEAYMIDTVIKAERMLTNQII